MTLPIFDNEDRMKYWKWIVTCFKFVSGLKINFLKSEIVPVVGTEDGKIVVVMFGCKNRKSSYSTP